MGLPVEVNNLMLGSLGGYTVGRSLRFRSSATAYLNRTFTTPTNNKIWTWSGWVKRGALGVTSYIMEGYPATAGNTNDRTQFYFTSGDALEYSTITTGTTTELVTTTQVFRDPSAWYHIIIVCDTTQATASNRLKFYVNGVQITAFSNTTYPALNANPYIDAAKAHYIGAAYNGSLIGGVYFDGYMAEVNFIDGQALTPSSFGAYDTNGVWQPKKYSGTYGTNGFYLPFNWSTSTSYAGSFNGSTQYLTVPTNTAFDMGAGNFTLEAWVLTDTTSNRNIVAREYTGNGSGYTTFVWSTTQFVASTSASAWDVNFTWSLPSANQWHHYAAVRNGNVYSVYIDGIRVGTQTVAGTLINGFGSALTIGYRNGQSLPSGSISNLRIVKGTAVYTSNFTPPTSALTAISGTSLLTLQSSTVIDNSTNAFTITNVGSVAMAASSPFGASILADASGNNNGWFGNNINYSAYGTTYDSMIDSPTNAAGTSTGIGNYAVLNPNFVTPSTTFSNGNLTVTKTAAVDVMAVSTIAMPSSKWYWEITITSLSASSNLVIGIVKNTQTNGTYSNTLAVLWNGNGNATRYGTSLGAVGTTFATNDVLGIALDMDSGTVSLYKNNTSIGTITGVDTTIPHYAFWDSYANGESAAINFGQRPFSYTPPSGYKALNTYNLPAPSIANGAQYMAATTYTGTGSALSVSNAVNGVGFQPDFVWMKKRSAASSHYLQDSVRGSGVVFYSDQTAAENAIATGVTSFNSSGFSLGTNADVNGSGASQVAWNWKAGGTGVTNNSGTITSTVSASPSSGFSIATYTGTGANATVGHGLGVAPSMVIVKQRSGANGWPVYHVSQTSAAYYMLLNQTDASNIAATVWNSTAPTSSVFSIGTAVGVNTSGQTYVAYCFSAVSGYSAFGKYTGNGSADGPFVYLGFRPRFFLIKRTDTTSNWYIWDSSRNTYNVADTILSPNLTTADVSASSINADILSNGFKLRNSDIDRNASGGTYVYMAFAEVPYNFARAR